MIYLSFGAGIQSTALLLMSNLGLCDRADVAIFADTQDEPQWVYDTVENARTWSKIPIEVVTAGKLSEKWEDSGAFIPAYTEGGGMLHRVCTERFKIRPIMKAIGRERSRLMIGISTDEAHRMKTNPKPWITNTWPLIDARMNRQDCERLLAEHKISVPKKSSCVYCPYHSDHFWKDLKTNHEVEWERAVAFDAKIRNTKKLKNAAYLHKSCVPLPMVDLQESQFEMFGNECDGVCGV